MMMDVLNRIDRCIARAEYAAMVGLMAALTVILTAQVALRYVFGNPLFWAEEAAVQMLVLATCIGTSYLIYRNGMLKVDLLAAILPETIHRPMQRVITAAGLLTLLAVCAYGVIWLMRPENRFLLSATTGMPKWYGHLAMTVCFGLMAWHLAVQLIRPHAAETKED
ncbi:TRAP transporter small permease [Neisseria leonii]|uniref:TRAP transporter small permease n=1 Tax=Neisseria leonii TaxID=2995413 RepID=UPI00237B3A78|nr:TRAP transporter small permease [Neisseria sp. 3986]MDD9326112.1 TRAP transporter small permease [Neisseria sp. 3986]